MEPELLKTENIDNITVSKETKQWARMMMEAINLQSKIQHHLVQEYNLRDECPKEMQKSHEAFMQIRDDLIGWLGDRAFERMLGSGFKEM